MKNQYLTGLLTGGLLVVSLIILTSSKNPEVGWYNYEYNNSFDLDLLLDTKTGLLYYRDENINGSATFTKADSIKSLTFGWVPWVSFPENK